MDRNSPSHRIAYEGPIYGKKIAFVPARRIFCGGLLAMLTGCGERLTTPSRPKESAATAKVEEKNETKDKEPSKADSRIDPNVITPITYEDLHIALEPDAVFHDWMLTQRVRDLDGALVRITGFMCGAIFQLNNVRDFPLMREKECPYGPGGEAHHVIAVEIRRGKPLSFTTQPITVEGRLRVAPFEGPNGKTWSLYRLENAAAVNR